MVRSQGAKTKNSKTFTVGPRNGSTRVLESTSGHRPVCLLDAEMLDLFTQRFFDHVFPDDQTYELTITGNRQGAFHFVHGYDQPTKTVLVGVCLWKSTERDAGRWIVPEQFYEEITWWVLGYDQFRFDIYVTSDWK